MGNGFNSVHLSDSFLDVLFVAVLRFLLSASFPWMLSFCSLTSSAVAWNHYTEFLHSTPYLKLTNTTLLMVLLRKYTAAKPTVRHPAFLAVHRLFFSEDASSSHCSFLCLLYCQVGESKIFYKKLLLSRSTIHSKLCLPHLQMKVAITRSLTQLYHN